MDEIVRENEPVPTNLEEIGKWWFVDIVLNVKETMLDSMNKRARSMGSWVREFCYFFLFLDGQG